MKRGKVIEVRAGMVACPAKHMDRPKANCFGCTRLVGFTADKVLCARK